MKVYYQGAPTTILMSQAVSHTHTPTMLMTSTLTPSGSDQPPPFPAVSGNTLSNEREKDKIIKASSIFCDIKYEAPMVHVHNMPVETENNLNKIENPLTYDESPTIRLTPTVNLIAAAPVIDPKRKFVCPYENCTKSYGKSSHLRSHLTWHTGIKPFVCTDPNCGKGFTRSDELNRHLRTHTGEKPFECVQCTKKFSRSDHLTKHLATHDRQMKDSNQKRPASNNIRIKISRKSPIKQDLPQSCFEASDYDGGLHFMALLGEAATQSQAQMSTKVLNSQKTLKVKVEPPNKYKAASTLPEKNLSPCLNDKTEVKYEPVDEMVDTLSELPLQNGPVTYGVPHFVQDRPFRCRECEKRFKRQDDLNRHIRTHTGEKPYACLQCCRRFVRSDHLKKHQQTHLKMRQL